MPSLEAARATAAAFVADVCRHPGDDIPRLIFADWLDEHGEGERAEFIREQIRLARLGDLSGSRRERELLGRTAAMTTRQVFEPEYDWLPEPVRYLFETGPRDGRHDRFWEWHRGFVEEVTLTAEAFAGGPCRGCVGTGSLSHAIDRDYHRTATCNACRGTGRSGGHAAALFRAAPLRRVTVVGNEPLDPLRPEQFWWWAENEAHPDHLTACDLPRCLWNLLSGGERPPHTLGRRYDSCEDAEAALSAACLLYGRRAAWPCPSCGGTGRFFAGADMPADRCPACAGRGHTVEEG